MLSFFRSSAGVTALEYALMVASIAIALATALVSFEDEIETVIRNLGDTVGDIQIETDDAQGQE